MNVLSVLPVGGSARLTILLLKHYVSDSELSYESLCLVLLFIFHCHGRGDKCCLKFTILGKFRSPWSLQLPSHYRHVVQPILSSVKSCGISQGFPASFKW